MKIAMIGHKALPSRIGGIEVVVTELATIMAAKGHEVIAYNRWRKGEDHEETENDTYEGVQLRRVSSPQIPGINAAVSAFTAARAAAREKPDVIHFHAEGPAIASALAHRKGIPVVVTVHGLDWQRRKWGAFARSFLRLAERTFVKYADEIIVLSPGNEDYFRKTYGRETVRIPNGIRRMEELAPHAIREKWGLERDGYVLFLARITPEKGLEYLIRAFSRIQTDKKLVIAGPADNEAYYEEMKKLAAGDPRILFTGFVSGDPQKELYGNCCCYCLPSELEGMPLTLLEALSSGSRCLVSDIPENTGVAPGFLHVFPSKDAEALQESLTSLLNMERDPAEREKQIAFIEERYSWQDVADRTIAVYEQAIRKHRSAK